MAAKAREAVDVFAVCGRSQLVPPGSTNTARFLLTSAVPDTVIVIPMLCTALALGEIVTDAVGALAANEALVEAFATPLAGSLT